MRYLLICLAAVALLPATSQACTCERLSPDQARREADLVFAGRIEEVITIDGSKRREPRIIVRFAVGRVWKGSVPATFSMHTYKEFSSCRGFFGELARPGETLLVFAFQSKAPLWKENRAPVGAANAGSYTILDNPGKGEVLRQDLVDALRDDATIYSTQICSGTSRWEDAGVVVREYGAFQAPEGALALQDPPAFDDGKTSNEPK